MNVVLVYNSKSGSALALRELRKKFKHHGIQVDKAIGMSKRLAHDLSAPVRSGATICAVGGDGTLSAVAGCLAGSKAVFVPLPGGTLNHFTKDLGIAQDMDEALQALAGSKIHAVDAATVNGKLFINNSSLGLYPSALRTRQKFEDYLGKWPAAIVASIRSLVKFRIYDVTINNETFRTPFIFVGNNNYAIDSVGGAVRARLDEGILSVMIAKTTTRRGLMKVTFGLLIGKAQTLAEFDTRTATSLTIHTTRNKINVARDGEVNRLKNPIYYASLPKALRVRF